MKKHRFIPVLLAAIIAACAFSACAGHKTEESATPDEAVNLVYPDGEGHIDDKAQGTQPDSADASTAQNTTDGAQETTTKKNDKNKTTTAPTKPAESTQPATIRTNVPADNIGGGNINPSLSKIQQQVIEAINALAVKSVKLSKSSLTLDVGETAELTISFEPEAPASKSCTVSSSNHNISATVSGTKIKVTGKTAGTCTLTVTSYNGHKATCDVTVNRGEVVITDDTVLSHGELVTADNVSRWQDAIIAAIESKGASLNSALVGESFEVSTAELNGDKSYNSAKELLVNLAAERLSSTTGGNISAYQFNCAAETIDNDYVFKIALSEITD